MVFQEDSELLACVGFQLEGTLIGTKICQIECFTLSPIIMEVENDHSWRQATHLPFSPVFLPFKVTITFTFQLEMNPWKCRFGRHLHYISHPGMASKNHESQMVQIGCCIFVCYLHSLKLTFSHLKMYDWNTSFLLGWPIFRCYVSFREVI